MTTTDDCILTNRQIITELERSLRTEGCDSYGMELADLLVRRLPKSYPAGAVPHCILAGNTVSALYYLEGVRA